MRAGKPLKQRVGQDLLECMERGWVKVQTTQLRFDVHVQHGQTGTRDDKGGVPCAVRTLCEKLAVLHHREFGKFRLKGRH